MADEESGLPFLEKLL
jgi:hypothetical protein